MKNLMTSLMKEGYVYRYPADRFEELKGKGHPFSSLTRQVKTGNGPMVEEVMQPLAEKVAISFEQAQILKQLAAAYQRFFKVQLDIFNQARMGEYDSQLTELIKSTCTKAEWELGQIDPGYADIHPFVRLDAILVDNRFIVMDVNTTRPAGVGDLIAYEKVIGDVSGEGLESFGIACNFAKEVKRCLDQWAGNNHLPGESLPVNIVAKQTDGDIRNFENITHKLIATGLGAKVIEPAEICKNGEYSVVIRGRIKEGNPDFPLLIDGYPDKKCLLSPLYRRFLGNKIWMYIFRIEPFKKMFQEVLGNDYQIFDDMIVETGLLYEGIVYFADRQESIHALNRKEWVVKDPASSSGRRMYIGRSITNKYWQRLIQELSNGTVLQRFYRKQENFTITNKQGEQEIKKLYSKYGIYIFGERLGGIELHARPSSIVHGARDTYMNSVYYQVQ